MKHRNCIDCKRRFKAYRDNKRCHYCQYIYKWHRAERFRQTRAQPDRVAAVTDDDPGDTHPAG